MAKDSKKIEWFGSTVLPIDSKRRITFPAPFHNDLKRFGDEKVIITVGLERPVRLEAWPAWEFEKEKRRIMAQPNSAIRRSMVRIFLGYSQECGFDGQGRITIPTALRKKLNAEVGDEMVWLGNGSFVELWKASDWESRFEHEQDKAIQFQAKMDAATAGAGAASYSRV